MDLDPVELRVLGCLLEKQRTTPDQYPLSLNALRLASNQSTNRDPVVDYDEGEIRSALDRLGTRSFTRLASGPGSRTAKFRHLLEETLQLTPSQLALLAVLLLRGPQTVAELRTRSERLYPFTSNADVEAGLAQLAERELVERLGHRPGERGERWRQLLGGGDAPAPAAPLAAPAPFSPLEQRLAELERRVAALEAGHTAPMRDEEELTEDARRSREETEALRRESLDDDSSDDDSSDDESSEDDSVDDDGDEAA